MKDFEEKLRDLVWSLIEEKVTAEVVKKIDDIVNLDDVGGNNPENILETKDFEEKVDEMIGDYIRYNVNVSLDC
ncbi:MAG: hypothetical protein ACPHI0_03450 [Paracoccaceae bacterium]